MALFGLGSKKKTTRTPDTSKKKSRALNATKKKSSALNADKKKPSSSQVQSKAKRPKKSSQSNEAAAVLAKMKAKKDAGDCAFC